MNFDDANAGATAFACEQGVKTENPNIELRKGAARRVIKLG